MEISTIMMIVFIIVFIISIWKIYVFLPDKRLIDDDTNATSVAELETLMLTCITSPSMSEKELFNAIIQHEAFDAKHYWRFNENRLKHLLHDYCVKNRPLRNIEDIY
ncbi:MAG: hypothetical protein U9N52_00255, partial [Campylobacterota bacterium]|nr:hypothetical protein [Campylobacterota bacterium]